METTRAIVITQYAPLRASLSSCRRMSATSGGGFVKEMLQEMVALRKGPISDQLDCPSSVCLSFWDPWTVSRGRTDTTGAHAPFYLIPSQSMNILNSIDTPSPRQSRQLLNMSAFQELRALCSGLRKAIAEITAAPPETHSRLRACICFFSSTRRQTFAGFGSRSLSLRLIELSRLVSIDEDLMLSRTGRTGRRTRQ